MLVKEAAAHENDVYMLLDRIIKDCVDGVLRFGQNSAKKYLHRNARLRDRFIRDRDRFIRE